MGIEREMDKTACHPSTKECEAQQSQPWPAEQPPVQETFMMRVYTPIELIDTAAKFQQKAKKRIQAWLVQLRKTGGHGIPLPRQVAENMSNITTHPALQQCSRGARWGGLVRGMHSLIVWTVLACWGA